MHNRILDISEDAAFLRVRHRQLLIERDGLEAVSVPLEDVAVLVVSHPRVTYTQAVLAGLLEQGGMFVACDGRRLPAGMLLPLGAHHLHAERLALQIKVSKPARKRLWRQIVRAKITAQANLLLELNGDDGGLSAMVSRVRSGDADNVEGQASRRYWPLLFGDANFRRDREGADQNRLLNYGYTVLRATVARAVCAAGLHPSLGLHHHNRYDAFCLADDLMEPFRPAVDRFVAHWLKETEPDALIDPETKRDLLETLAGPYELEGQKRSLFDVLTRAASSLLAVFADERKELLLPEIISGTKRT